MPIPRSYTERRNTRINKQRREQRKHDLIMMGLEWLGYTMIAFCMVLMAVMIGIAQSIS